MLNQNVRRLALAAGLFCAGVGAAQAQVVISQVYGGGGNSGATLKSDFIELRNNGATAVDLSTWSVQYASSAGTTWQRTNLAGSIPAGGYYLVKQADGTGGSNATMPAPDATGGIMMSATAGKVALVAHQVSLTGACPTGNGIADFVGFGAANCFEGSGATPAPSNTTAVLRKNAGAQDGNDNANDFASGAPDPRNSGSPPPPPEDPPIASTIHAVQGNGARSPLVDKKVIVEGVVTALKFNNGFFLQAPDAEADGDPATSEGVFVFTGSAPTVSVGQRVRVAGTVAEYVPDTNKNQLSITEITNPSVQMLATDAPMPAARALDDTMLSPSATPTTLEHLEGMRVSLAEAVVVGASDGRITETTASSSTDGVFYVTLPDVPVPFREPGIGVMDTIAIPAGKHPPRFDTNQERLMVRSRGQVGAQPLALDNEAVVTGLVGALDYFDGTWALLPDTATPPQAIGGRTPVYVEPAKYEEATIGGFNLLRFFDEVNDGNGAPTLTVAALDFRLGKTARAICEGLKAPDILGVVEVENLRVLQLLSERIDATCAVAPKYVPYLVQGNDPGGINVGVLASTRDVGGKPRVEVVEVEQFGKTATLANPNGTTSLLNDRPPLLARTLVHQDNGASYPVSVIVNHLRSLNDIDNGAPGSGGWDSEGARVRGKRAAQAAFLAGLVQQLETQQPGERFVLVGDFNAFEFNDGYVDVMGIVKGTPAPDDEVLTAVASPIVQPLLDGKDFVDDPNERYSYVFEGSAQTLDHALFNQAVVDGALHVEVDHARINADFGVHHFGNPSLPIRVSDHDPVRVRIAVPSFRSADLRMTMTAPANVHPAQSAQLDATVSNAGPNDAPNASVAFVIDGAWSPTTTAPAGWHCDASVQDAIRTTVLCRTANFASGASAQFDIDVAIPQEMVSGALEIGASIASSIADPANANNTVDANVAIEAESNLVATIDGATEPAKPGTKTALSVQVRNDGPDASRQPTLRIEADVTVGMKLAAPGGWSCTREDVTDGFASMCRYGGWLASGEVGIFQLSMAVPGRPQGATVRVEAASPTTPDKHPLDNSAVYEIRAKR